MPVSTAVTHKHNVMSIAERGVAHGRRELLGVLYDEVARCAHIWVGRTRALVFRMLYRTEWEDQSGKMGKLFKLDERAAVICPTLERRAEIEHDKLFGAPTLPTANTRGSEGKGERKVRKVDDEGSRGQGKGGVVICGYCGKPGHAAISCYKWNVWRATNDVQSKGKTGKGDGKGGKSRVMRTWLVCWCAPVCNINFAGEERRGQRRRSCRCANGKEGQAAHPLFQLRRGRPQDGRLSKAKERASVKEQTAKRCTGHPR